MLIIPFLVSSQPGTFTREFVTLHFTKFMSITYDQNLKKYVRSLGIDDAHWAMNSQVSICKTTVHLPVTPLETKSTNHFAALIFALSHAQLKVIRSCISLLKSRQPRNPYRGICYPLSLSVHLKREVRREVYIKNGGNSVVSYSGII